MIDEAKKLLELQGQPGNWDYDPYMFGMYNGMELILATVEDRDPKFRAAPDKFLTDTIRTNLAAKLRRYRSSSL